MLDRFPGLAWIGSAAASWAASTQIGQVVDELVWLLLGTAGAVLRHAKRAQ